MVSRAANERLAEVTRERDMAIKEARRCQIMLKEQLDRFD